MQKTTCVLAGCTALLVAAGAAQAQTPPEEGRWHIGVNLGIQPQSRTFTETAVPVVYGEPASVTVHHGLGSRPFIDASAAFRVWENLGLGVGYSRLSSTETPPVSALVPSPLVFGNARPASATAANLSHTESTAHALFLWMMPVSPKAEVAAIAGASFVTVTQDLVSGLTAIEGAPPFASVAISSVQTQAVSKTAPALTLGADFTYLMSKQVGAGGFVRFSRLSGGNVDLDSPTGSGQVSVSAGGFQLGVGLRVRF